MITTLSHLRRLEAQVNLSVSRADLAGAEYENQIKRQQARQISIEASQRLQEVAGLLQRTLDFHA
ncbi:MAG: hypothetical protein KF812_05960 [Fimbriimonadaceae bacterium]|nr:hypothetical protein [Fimbriimonadaceae bacterium]